MMLLSRRAGVALLAALTVLASDACSDSTAPIGGALAYADCLAPEPYWPTAGWRSTCPAAVGLDTAVLRGVLNVMRDSMPAAWSLVVARRGYIALEAYYRGAKQQTVFEIRSVTKVVTATVVGAAIEQGFIPGTDQTLVGYFPEYLDAATDPRKRAITIEQLLNLTAGFDLNAAGSDQRTFATAVLSRPLVADPGVVWSYDEPLYHLLSVIVGEASGHSALDVASSRIFSPLGMSGAATRWPQDGASNPFGASGLRLTAREMLKIGQLYLHEGMWDGIQVLPDGWVRDNVERRPDGATDDQVYWIRGWRQTVYAGHLTYLALGYGGQYIFVVPDLELVAAATADPYAPERFFPQFARLLRDHIIPAVTD